MLRIVEIKALPDGGHRSQTYHGEVLDGYALILEGTETPNFPYGDVEAAEIDGVMTMTKWTPRDVPEPERPTPAQQRETAYNTQPIVEWEGAMLTVTQAATKWQYYAAEGDMVMADALTVLIAAAKQTVRDQYPDEEVQ